MAIRLSFLQSFNSSVRGITRAQQQANETQQQISSGRRVVKPSDDPVASARIIQVNQELSQIGQYIDNAGSVENRLSLAENQISQVSNLLVRIRELTIQAGSLVVTQNDRVGIAAEVDARIDELLSLANTKDINGEYIFAGFQGSVQPFERTIDGNFVYHGDDGQRLVPVATSTKIAISDSGKSIFMDIDSTNNLIDATADVTNTGGATISSSSVNEQGNYDNNAYPEDYVVQFNAGTNAYDIYTRTDILNGGVNTAVFSVANTGSPITIDANSTPLAAPTNLGWEITLSGTPADGDTFQVASTSKQNVMTTLANLSEGLKVLTSSPADEILLDELFANTLNNLDAAENNMSTIKSEIGARNNTLDSVRELHEGVELVNQEVLSELRDLDYAEAISRLSIETFTLEAAQQSFVKINSLSLFNFLR